MVTWADIAEGARCPVLGCGGTLEIEYPDGGCSCHIAPPCGRCVGSFLVCDICRWESTSDLPADSDAPLADALRAAAAGRKQEPDLGKSQAEIEAEALARNRAIFAKGVF